jgi:hypothetical protein
MRKHVYYYTHLDVPPDIAVGCLASDPSSWLPAPAESGPDEWQVTLRAEGALPEAEEALGAVVEVGAPTAYGEGMLRTVRWRPAEGPSPLQILEADLELTSLDGQGCRLAIVGTYRAPLSVTRDPQSPPRVIESCLRRFVLDIAHRIGAATLPA